MVRRRKGCRSWLGRWGRCTRAGVRREAWVPQDVPTGTYTLATRWDTQYKPAGATPRTQQGTSRHTCTRTARPARTQAPHRARANRRATGQRAGLRRVCRRWSNHGRQQQGSNLLSRSASCACCFLMLVPCVLKSLLPRFRSSRIVCADQPTFDHDVGKTYGNYCHVLSNHQSVNLIFRTFLDTA